MAIKSKFIFVLLLGASTISTAVPAFANDSLPPLTNVSIQVQPLMAVSSPGKTLSLFVRCEGINGVGAQTPVSVTGAPYGTSIKVMAMSKTQAMIALVFPMTVAKGQYELSVNVGSPAPLVEQKVAIEIEE